jgi:hypothetical protein
MPQHQQFGVLRGVPAQQSSRHRQQSAGDAVQDRDDHPRSIPAAGERLSSGSDDFTSPTCSIKSTSGGHDKWICPCSKHSANLPRHGVISPGVVASTKKRLTCLPEGWLK